MSARQVPPAFAGNQPLFADSRDFVRQRAALCYSVAAVTCLRKGLKTSAVRYALRAITKNAMSLKPYAVLALSLLPAALVRVMLRRWSYRAEPTVRSI